MGSKKKNHKKHSHHKSKNSPQLPSSSSFPDSLSSISIRAIYAAAKGSHNVAQKLIQDLVSNAPKERLRIIASIYEMMYTQSVDFSVREYYLNNAIDYARKSVSFAPNAIEFSYYLAYLLSKIAKDARGREEVIQECKRALAIQNPVDPLRVSGEISSEKLIFLKGKVIDIMNGCIIEKKNRIESYWKSMSIDEQHSVFKVSIFDFKDHFSSLKDQNIALRVIEEAMSFVKDHGQWKFWKCYCCDEKFTDSESHLQHVVDKHLGILSPQQESVLPTALDKDWCSIISNSPWKSLDTSAVVLKLEELCGNNGSNDVSKFEIIDIIMGSLPTTQHGSHRTMNLQSIHLVLCEMMKNGFLAAEHVNKLIEYSANKLQGVLPRSNLRELGLDETHIYICLLGSSELEEILKILLETYQWSMGMISNNEIIFDQKLVTSNAGFQIKESIRLNGDTLCLSFDEQLLQGGYDTSERCTLDSSYFGENGASATFSIGGDQKDSGPPTSNDLLKWILECPSIEVHLGSWTGLREEEKLHRLELNQKIDLLKQICQKKNDLLSYQKALPATGGEALTSGTGVCALEIPEGDDKTNNSHHQAITSLKETIDLQLMKIDALITRVIKDTENLKLEINAFVADDYCEIMAPLVKSYIQAYLEKQADKNSAEKFKAKMEEFSALVAGDAKEDDKEKGDNQSKQLQKKSSKKKKRIGANTAILKTSGTNKYACLTQKTEEYDLNQVPLCDHTDISNRGISGGDDVKQMEDEIKHQKELEDDNRKLAEKLAQQMQFENDCKQKGILQKCNEASKGDLFSDDLKHTEDELKHLKELDEDNRKLAENVEQQLQFENDSKQKAILQKCNKASKGDLFSDDLKHMEDELKQQKELDEDNRKLAENVEQQLQLESDGKQIVTPQPYKETTGGSRGADIPPIPDIADEITQIYKSLHPRPGTEIIEATQSRINNIEQEEKVAIEAICNQQKPQDIPQELFNMLKMAQKTLVLYMTTERKREASKMYLDLLDLEKVHAQINKAVA